MPIFESRAVMIKPRAGTEGLLVLDGLAMTFTPDDTSIAPFVETLEGFERQEIQEIPGAQFARDVEALKYVGVSITHTRTGALWCLTMISEFGFYLAGEAPMPGEREKPRISPFLRKLDPTPFGEPQSSEFPGKQPLL